MTHINNTNITNLPVSFSSFLVSRPCWMRENFHQASPERLRAAALARHEGSREGRGNLQMEPIQAMNHGDSTMTITITNETQIEWLRLMGISEAFLRLGEHHLPSEERCKIYPTLSEAMEPALFRLLGAVSTFGEW